ncbi:MAG TPA: peroxiredoxin [Bacteroidota bacterium]|nr:peroxiredoxin [Bacteroidota bacterium]
MLAPGTMAPDFTLPDADGNSRSLREYRGRTVVLVFYPKDHTAVCSKQLGEYAEHYAAMAGLGAELLAVSADSVASHDSFRISCHFPFPLLADVDKAVCKAYGVLNVLGMPQRAVFVIDDEGGIRFAEKTFPLWYLPARRILKELAA